MSEKPNLKRDYQRADHLLRYEAALENAWLDDYFTRHCPRFDYGERDTWRGDLRGLNHAAVGAALKTRMEIGHYHPAYRAGRYLEQHRRRQYQRRYPPLVAITDERYAALKRLEAQEAQSADRPTLPAQQEGVS